MQNKPTVTFEMVYNLVPFVNLSDYYDILHDIGVSVKIDSNVSNDILRAQEYGKLNELFHRLNKAKKKELVSWI